jgi:hypothetical protein
MDKPIVSGLKTLFLVHAVVGFLFGLGYLLIPATIAGWFNMPLADEPYVRLLGAAILGFAAASILGYLAHSWAEVKIVVQAEVVWTFLAAVLSLWFVLGGAWPAGGWIMFVIMALFFLAFAYFYWREATTVAPRPAPRM